MAKAGEQSNKNSIILMTNVIVVFITHTLCMACHTPMLIEWLFERLGNTQVNVQRVAFHIIFEKAIS